MALFNMFQTSETKQSASKIAYTDFIAQAKSGGITDVLIEGNNLKGERARTQPSLAISQTGQMSSLRWKALMCGSMLGRMKAICQAFCLY